MFFDEVPPDTSLYMIAGYAIFFAITAIYLISLIIRTRNLNRDLTAMEALEYEQQAEAKTMATPPSKAKPAQSKTTKTKKSQKKTARKR